ncbi:MucR family transcriptional regulator [Shinella sp. NM-101]|uniref:MucR family transcriptional regulator n=1 Tax=Shinella sp. NM-101 TaxID=2744455 RepID=UPI002729BC35|nr:MucR family transcriptional regulator [Shinella sp. NM-101]
MTMARTMSNELATRVGNYPVAGPHHDLCIRKTSEIIVAYVSWTTVPQNELPGLIDKVYRELSKIAVAEGNVEAATVSARPVPPVPIRLSVTPDVIICLEDGLPFKSLRRHLKARFNMTPDEYREKWGLPAHYPMVAPNYAMQRSKLAKKIGLGRVAKRGPKS